LRIHAGWGEDDRVPQWLKHWPPEAVDEVDASFDAVVENETKSVTNGASTLAKCGGVIMPLDARVAAARSFERSH
jgi:hypothetical protein